MSDKEQVYTDELFNTAVGCLPIYELFEKDTYEEDNLSIAGCNPDPEPGAAIPESAIGFLEEARKQMEARAQLRDSQSGERTAAKIAAVFNALTDHNLTEADAWTFLIVMKMVRAQAGNYHRDDYVDGAAYMSLLGECESVREHK
jgi:hypothetical protein